MGVKPKSSQEILMLQTDKRKRDKGKFDRVIKLAHSLPQPAIHDLLRALILPIQADYLLAVGTEGQDARPEMNERELFFSQIIWAMDYSHMKSLRHPSEDYPLALATAKILPWPWNESSYRNTLSDVGSTKGNAWKQDINHSVTLWLPWKIGFVRGGNHSIASGVLTGEGEVIPESVYDMSYLLDIINTDGYYWYMNDKICERVTDYRTAAFFEIGRLL